MKNKEKRPPAPLIKPEALLEESNGWYVKEIYMKRMEDDQGTVWWEERAVWGWLPDWGITLK